MSQMEGGPSLLSQPGGAASWGAAERAWRTRGSTAVFYDHRPATLHRLRVAHVRRVALTQVRSTRRGSRGLFRTHARSYAAHITLYTFISRRADRGWTLTAACRRRMAMRNDLCRLSHAHTLPHARARARNLKGYDEPEAVGLRSASNLHIFFRPRSVRTVTGLVYSCMRRGRMCVPVSVN